MYLCEAPSTGKWRTATYTPPSSNPPTSPSTCPSFDAPLRPTACASCYPADTIACRSRRSKRAMKTIRRLVHRLVRPGPRYHPSRSNSRPPPPAIPSLTPLHVHNCPRPASPCWDCTVRLTEHCRIAKTRRRDYSSATDQSLVCAAVHVRYTHARIKDEDDETLAEFLNRKLLILGYLSNDIRYESPAELLVGASGMDEAALRSFIADSAGLEESARCDACMLLWILLSDFDRGLVERIEGGWRRTPSEGRQVERDSVKSG